MVIRRAFESETPRDVLLLMLEEMGELAKAIRKLSGFKFEANTSPPTGSLEEELADVLIYLLDLANGCGIDLISAMQKKELQNEKRHWKSQK